MRPIHNEMQLLPLQSEHPSTMPDAQKHHAVYVRNARKSYGIKAQPVSVLNGLNMTVPKGAIYGLLGASGCGKTTLLNAVIGRHGLDSGEVWVLGGSPGTKHCDIPGPRLGYMPQELALYGELSIRETLIFYGWVVGMKLKKIRERTTYLVKLLLLPDADQKVRELSTGQQRRVSLAAAIIHEPELMILDEPTVGVDPVLRQIIWDHFLHLIEDEKKSIVITTHYIDETRQAQLIGLMRNGVLLAEQSPESLITQHNAITLEEVFLKLSIKQNQSSHYSIPSNIVEPSTSSTRDNTFIYDYINEDSSLEPNNLPEIPSHQLNYISKIIHRPTVNFQHVNAVVLKNGLWILRNIPVMLFGIFLPFLSMVAFCLCIGHDPIDLPVAVVNYESNNNQICNPLACNSTTLGCTYLKYLKNRGLMLNYYHKEEDAIQSVMKGKSYASVILKHNYSISFHRRIVKWRLLTEADLDIANVDVFRDVSNKVIANYLLFYLFDTFLLFVQDYVQSCNYRKEIMGLPVNIVQPVYGEKYPNFTDFIAPGVALSVTFMMGVGLTAAAMVIERNEGSLNRYLVVGISELEIIIAYLLCQFGVLVFQVLMSVVCMFVVFDLTLKGSAVLVLLILLLAGICGMALGLVISAFCDNERMILYTGLGMFVPIIALGGIIWPVEATDRLLKPIMPFLPLTQSNTALRSILQRGWGMAWPSVYWGFISSAAWTMIFFLISMIIYRFKRT